VLGLDEGDVMSRSGGDLKLRIARWPSSMRRSSWARLWASFVARSWASHVMKRRVKKGEGRAHDTARRMKPMPSGITVPAGAMSARAESRSGRASAYCAESHAP